MFQGNKPVLILPTLLMIFMFVGGYIYLKQSEAVTNEELQRVIELDANTVLTGERSLRVDIEWDWTTMPKEGLRGDDYIGVALMDKDSDEVRTDVKVSHATLELTFGDDVLKKIEGNVVDNGVIFVFPNRVSDNRSYGNVGRATVVFEGERLDETLTRVHYLHTWTEGPSLKLEDALFSDPSFEGEGEVPYWLLSR